MKRRALLKLTAFVLFGLCLLGPQKAEAMLTLEQSSFVKKLLELNESLKHELSGAEMEMSMSCEDGCKEDGSYSLFLKAMRSVCDAQKDCIGKIQLGEGADINKVKNLIDKADCLQRDPRVQLQIKNLTYLIELIEDDKNYWDKLVKSISKKGGIDGSSPSPSPSPSLIPSLISSFPNCGSGSSPNPSSSSSDYSSSSSQSLSSDSSSSSSPSPSSNSSSNSSSSSSIPSPSSNSSSSSILGSSGSSSSNSSSSSSSISGSSLASPSTSSIGPVSSSSISSSSICSSSPSSSDYSFSSSQSLSSDSSSSSSPSPSSNSSSSSIPGSSGSSSSSSSSGISPNSSSPSLTSSSSSGSFNLESLVEFVLGKIDDRCKASVSKDAHDLLFVLGKIDNRCKAADIVNLMLASFREKAISTKDANQLCLALIREMLDRALSYGGKVEGGKLTKGMDQLCSALEREEMLNRGSVCWTGRGEQLVRDAHTIMLTVITPSSDERVLASDETNQASLALLQQGLVAAKNTELLYRWGLLDDANELLEEKWLKIPKTLAWEMSEEYKLAAQEIQAYGAKEATLPEPRMAFEPTYSLSEAKKWKNAAKWAMEAGKKEEAQEYAKDSRNAANRVLKGRVATGYENLRQEFADKASKVADEVEHVVGLN